jgi:exonuclease III
MKMLMWNVRGLGKPARRNQVRNYILQEGADLVGLQETMKQDFTDKVLEELSGGLYFKWVWLAARGRSGGILMGVKVDTLELESHSVGDYTVLMTIRNKLNNFRWEVVTVYGPAQHDYSLDFLLELDTICSRGGLPKVLGGDFNLIRNEEDKSSDNYNNNLMNHFNDFIGRHHLREVVRAGSKYTWTNKQEQPIL